LDDFLFFFKKRLPFDFVIVLDFQESNRCRRISTVLGLSQRITGRRVRTQ
jgi:hypothetical protein